MKSQRQIPPLHQLITLSPSVFSERASLPWLEHVHPETRCWSTPTHRTPSKEAEVFLHSILQYLSITSVLHYCLNAYTWGKIIYKLPALILKSQQISSWFKDITSEHIWLQILLPWSSGGGYPFWHLASASELTVCVNTSSCSLRNLFRAV